MRQDKFSWAVGPLVPYAPGFQAELVRRGYAPVSVHNRLIQFKNISRWLGEEDLQASDLNEHHVERFVASRRASGRVTWVTGSCLTLPLDYLASIGVVPARVEERGKGPCEEMLAAYGDYLVNERGLVASTIAAYLRIARYFCEAVRWTPDEFENLCASDVTEFVVETCRRSSIPLAKKTVTALASLLRYLHVSGLIAKPLTGAVPKVAGRRARSSPDRLGASQVARVLSSCDRRGVVGRRDYAILMLLSRLGLRAGEVAALTLDDIDWHHGEIVVRGKGNRHERLPLPCDCGEAVVAYLRHGRSGAPQGCRTLFLCVTAPGRAITSSAVCTVVQRAAERAGLPGFGAHLLRHFVACEILRHGASLAEVAQVLRQRNMQVTAIYATPEPAALRELARPWPGGVR